MERTRPQNRIPIARIASTSTHLVAERMLASANGTKRAKSATSESLLPPLAILQQQHLPY